MNRRQKIIVSITGIAIVSLFLIALTYGYYLTKIKGNSNSKSITATTDNLELVYGDDDGSIIGDGEVITPNTTFEPKTFSVENKGKSTLEYSVVLDNVNIINASTGEETEFESNDFVYTLTCTSGCNGVSDETTLPLYNNGILVSNSIDEGEKQTYSITITYKDTGVDQSDDMNKSLSARINIIDIRGINPYSDNTDSLAYNIINNAKLGKNGTELKAIPDTTPGVQTSSYAYKTDDATVATTEGSMTVSTTYQGYYWTYGTGYTINESTGKFSLTGVSTCQYNDGSCNETLVGKYIIATSAGSNSSSTNTQKTTTNKSNIYIVTEAPASSTSDITVKYKKMSPVLNSAEKVLSIAQDDYGNSYYYRGNVEDNYVNFAGMCWRIVRIAGDGATKLILEDQDDECSKTMNGNWDFQSDVSYGVDVSGETFETATTTINYLYGVGMADSLKDFQESKLKSFQTKLKSGDWCYDDTAYQDEAGTIPITDTSTYYANSTDFYYGTYTRLINKKQPSLKCAGTNMTKFGDNTTDMYAGALTADEIVLAGGKVSTSNKNYYLINDYLKGYEYFKWWSLSPYEFSSRYDVVLGMNYFGEVVLLDLDISYAAVRPSINLKSGIEIASGDGSIENPYTIK